MTVRAVVVSRLLPAVLLLLAFCCQCASAAPEEFVVSNPVLSRTVSKLGSFLKTTKLQAHGVEALAHPTVEFLLEIERDGELVVMVPSDFKPESIRTERQGREQVTRVRLSSRREGLPLTLHISYFSDPLTSYLQKSVKIEPNGHPDTTVLKRIVIEDLRLASAFSPLTPTALAPASDSPSGGGLSGRFRTDVSASFAAIDSSSGEGLFFFVPALFGEERVKVNRDLLMAESMEIPLRQGYTTARATIGAVKGGPDLTYARFREFVASCWPGSTGKWSAELVSSDGSLDAAACAADMEFARTLGFIDSYRVAPGWISTNARDGLPALAERAKSVSLRLVYPAKLSSSDWPANADALEQQLLRLVGEGGAGAVDIATDNSGSAQERFRAIHRLRSTIEKLRAANRDLRVRLVAQRPLLPADLHLLGLFDAIRYAGASGDSTAARLERYRRSFVFPSAAAGPVEPNLDARQLRYSLLSGISDSPQAFDRGVLSAADPGLGQFATKMQSFRERFAAYFGVYQHVLDAPDGTRVDGEAHIIDNRGFLLLFNPTDATQAVRLPLDESVLDLRGRLKLEDWTSLDAPVTMTEAGPGDEVEVRLEPLSAKVIGINIAP